MDPDVEFDFGADYIDSRDVIARIEYLEEGFKDDAADPDSAELDEDEKRELADLKAFAEEAEGYVSDWIYGEQLIADHNFEDYAIEMAHDIGAVDKDANWPTRHIDWEAAADELKQDFTSFELRGTTYCGR
jgi:hypothetical protein